MTRGAKPVAQASFDALIYKMTKQIISKQINKYSLFDTQKLSKWRVGVMKEDH